jgi:hypothetical protein
VKIDDVSRHPKWSGAFPLQRLSFEVGFVLSAQHAERLVHVASISPTDKG